MTFKDELIEINQDISSLLGMLKALPSMERAFDGFENICKNIQEQTTDDIIRVAIVGTIKSGKSTFVNSLFKGDYLKRGAGVVTSIVTRIRKGDRLLASLFFKSWDEVNAVMKSALTLFPNRPENFDIRDDNQREIIEEALNALTTDMLIIENSRSPNTVLLESFLQGYDRIKQILSNETIVQKYEKDRFSEHKTFVGDDALAVYLKDIMLEISAEGIPDNIEIADCQGSDSPNPLHLAMIQDYLLTANFLIYVVSSRTGLRQADIRFLSIIRKMGIMKNVLFIINCDFDEHTSYEDMKSVIEKIRKEIALIAHKPEIFAMSALFNLFKSCRNLTEKEHKRFMRWQNEREFSEFSDLQTKEFESIFFQKMTHERYVLSIKTHLDRLSVVISGILNYIKIHQEFVSADAGKTDEMLDKIAHQQQKMTRVRSMIRSTLNGAVSDIKANIRTAIDRFFDMRSGEIFSNIVKFIRTYDIGYDQYSDAAFTNTLYMIFDEFRRAVDNFMTEGVNPEVIRFIRLQEKQIESHFEAITGPYDIMLQSAFSEYNANLPFINPAKKDTKILKTVIPDADTAKKHAGLSIPPIMAYMRYSARIKTDAITRLWIFSIITAIKRLLGKPTQSKADRIRAMKAGFSRLKRETESALVFNFKDYYENIKHQYFFKLIDAMGDMLYDMLCSRFVAYTTDISQITKYLTENQIDKHRLSADLQQIEHRLKFISEQIENLAKKLE